MIDPELRERLGNTLMRSAMREGRVFDGTIDDIVTDLAAAGYSVVETDWLDDVIDRATYCPEWSAAKHTPGLDLYRYRSSYLGDPD